MIWRSSLLTEQWILWAPILWEAHSREWFLLRFTLVLPWHCATQRGGRSYSSFSGQMLHLESQWLTASLVVINEKYVSVAINERLVPLFFHLVIWVAWAAQGKCVQNPARSRAPEGGSDSREELSLQEKTFEEPCKGWPGQSVGTAPSSLWVMFEHGCSHISSVRLRSCFGHSYQQPWGKGCVRAARHWDRGVEMSCGALHAQMGWPARTSTVFLDLYTPCFHTNISRRFGKCNSCRAYFTQSQPSDWRIH